MRRAAAALLTAALALAPTLPAPARADPVLAAPVLAAPVLAAPVRAAASGEAPVVTATLSVETGIVRPGEGLTVSGTVVNRGAAALPPGAITVSVSRAGLARTELEARLAGTAGQTAPATVPMGNIPVPAIPEVSSAPVSFAFSAPEVDAALGGSGWGARLLVAELRVGAAVETSSSGFVWSEGDAPVPVGVVTVIPLTTPASGDGLLGSAELAAYTAPDGNLTRTLDAALGTPAALALDPRIPASIRALGTSAPQSAVAWLRRLDAAGNTVFPLQYADADPALQRRAGAAGLLAPGSFESSLDPANFPDGGPLPADGNERPSSRSTPPAASPAPASTPTTSPPATSPPTSPPTTTPPTTAPPTTSPSPTDAPTTGVPTAEQLLGWDYSFTDLVWPTSLAPGDVAFWAASGFPRSLVPSTSLGVTAVPPATAAIEGSPAIVVDSVLSRAVSAAAFSAADAERRRALADTTALLAATAQDAAGPVVIAFDRSAPAGTEDLPAAFTAVRSLPWVSVQPFDALPTAGPALAPAGEAPADPRTTAVTELLGADRALADFATLLERPELLTGRERLRLLALLSAQWAGLPDAWATAAAELRTRFDGILRSVTITSTSGFAFGAFNQIPFFVENSLDFPVTVMFTGRPSNGRLLVRPVTATIEAQSSSRVEMPAQTIANGRVTLEVRATSPVTGLPVADPALLQFDVQAEWETVGLIGMSVLVAGLFGFGLIRSIRRGRREKTESAGSAG